MKISRGQRIRDYLREQGRPCAPAEVAKALDLPTLPVCHTIGNMLRDGMLGRTGDGRSFHYYLIREATPRGPRKSIEEKLARKAMRERERLDRMRLARGGMTGAEYNAKRAADKQRRIEEAARRRREKEEAKNLAAALRRQAAPKRPAAKVKPMKTKAQRLLNNTPAPPSAVQTLTERLPKAPRVQSVEEFVAAGGRIERLPAVWEQARAA